MRRRDVLRLARAGELPSRAAVGELFDELDFQHGTQAYLWALPLVAFAAWQRVHEEGFGAQSGDFVLYESYDDKLGILTANATTPYVIGFANLYATGPLVIDVPKGASAGGLNDCWQRELGTLGEMGPDRGEGGQYLLIPPGQSVPDIRGYHLVLSTTMNVFIGLRALDPDPAEARALIEGFRVYPYVRRTDPQPTRLLTPQGREWYGGQPRGMAFWQRLHTFLQDELVAERDRFFIAMLAPLGIEKGRPFRPDERQRRLLVDAAAVGEAIAKANSFAKRFAGARRWPDRRWDRVLMLADPSQRVEHYDQLEERASWFYEAFGCSKAMLSETPGVGQAYLGAYTDGDGNWLDGGKPYRLTISADLPAKGFWSVTVYDAETRCFVDNPQRRADVSSRMALTTNPDGSAELRFGPTAPAGVERNWVQTKPGRHWFAYLRLYGPTEAYFAHTWKPNDIELAAD